MSLLSLFKSGTPDNTHEQTEGLKTIQETANDLLALQTKQSKITAFNDIQNAKQIERVKRL